MLYNNYTNEAIMELERQRTYDYGMEFEVQSNECDSCGNTANDIYLVNSKHICSKCICNEIRDAFETARIAPTSSGIDALYIFNKIIEDFSDNEIMCYAEELYEQAE